MYTYDLTLFILGRKIEGWKDQDFLTMTNCDEIVPVSGCKVC